MKRRHKRVSTIQAAVLEGPHQVQSEPKAKTERRTDLEGTMEKIFTPNRWFVGFCALLILAFGALKVVADMHLAEIASNVGKDIYSWEWQDVNSTISAVHSRVLRRDANDAVVEVSGHQILVAKVGESPTMEKESSQETDVKAVLTFYRRNSRWELGKVELK